MNFWPINKTESFDENRDLKKEEVKNVKLEITPPTIAQKFNEFLRQHLPGDFEKKFEDTKPFIVSSLIAWPLYWLYRGLEWKRYRHKSTLPMYIQKTYLQAKFIQFTIVMCGLVMALGIDEKPQNKAIQEKN